MLKVGANLGCLDRSQLIEGKHRECCHVIAILPPEDRASASSWKSVKIPEKFLYQKKEMSAFHR